jgi:hypothetical protein
MKDVDNIALWRTVFSRASEEEKELAREELRKRGQIGEPITEQRQEV